MIMTVLNISPTCLLFVVSDISFGCYLLLRIAFVCESNFEFLILFSLIFLCDNFSSSFFLFMFLLLILLNRAI